MEKREIKFRAYNSKSKTMLIQGCAYDENRVEFWRKWETTSHMSEPMQYTGLSDRSNVEIYEGDIVEAYRGLKYKVHFSYGIFLFYCLATRDNSMYHELHEIVVIGNIYENPDKLNHHPSQEIN